MIAPRSDSDEGSPRLQGVATVQDPASDQATLWNQAIAEAGQPGDEPAAVAVRRRSKAALRESMAKRR